MDTLRTSSCTSFSAGWRCSIPCLPASYRIGVREGVLSLGRSRARVIDDANVPV